MSNEKIANLIIFSLLSVDDFKLFKEYDNSDPLVIKLLNKYEFHIMPLANPDGYEYSHTTVSEFILFIQFV